jgi:chromosome partitioning protein
MKILTVASQKGGVGKSTIACNIAVQAAHSDLKVLLIDADSQGSSMSFRSIRESDDIKAMSITTPTLHKDLPTFSGFDLIIVDAGGRDSATLRSAMSVADLLIIPVLPSTYDIWATGDTIDALREIRGFREVNARLLMNRLFANTVMARDTLESLKDIENDAALLDSRVYNREDYSKAIAAGKGVVEFNPNGKAALEIKNLVAEIRSILSI